MGTVVVVNEQSNVRNVERLRVKNALLMVVLAEANHIVNNLPYHNEGIPNRPL